MQFWGFYTVLKVQKPVPVFSADCNVTSEYCRSVSATLSMQWIVPFDFQDCAFSCLSLSLLSLLLAHAPSLSRPVSVSVSVAGMWLGSHEQTLIGRCSYRRSNLEKRKPPSVFLSQGFCIVNSCKALLHTYKNARQLLISHKDTFFLKTCLI